MIPEYFNKTWLEEYVQNLQQFKEDLDLKLDGYNIYLSVDFYDIYEYCFPYSINSDLAPTLNDNFYIKYYYSQISRSTMFFMLSNIYDKPNALLAPYTIEFDKFVTNLDANIDRFIAKELKKYQKNPNPEVAEIIKDAKKTNDYDELITYINQNYAKIIYFYNRGFSSSQEMFQNLISNFFTSDMNHLFKTENKLEFDFYSVFFKYRTANIDRNLIENEVHARRENPRKYFQNIRDADAIYSIQCLNEIYNKHKKAFCLFSSAPHLQPLISDFPKLNVGIAIVNNRDFLVLRNPRFFLDVMFEINNYFNYSMKKTHIESIDIRELRQSIIKTLSKLNFYKSYLAGAGGQLTEIIQSEARRSINMAETIKQMDSNLSILLDEYLNIKENLDNYRKQDRKIALAIINACGDEPFSKGLFLRRLEIEKKNLQIVISALKKSERGSLNVTLFSLPFRLYLIDSKASDIKDKIIFLSKNGRNEFRKLNEISIETLDNIYKELDELMTYSQEIHNDETLIALQFVLLYISRYDLVDLIYDLFIKNVPKPLQREMTYIYLVSFIKKFRAIKIFDANYFLDMAKLCDGYLYSQEMEINIDARLYEMHKCSKRYILRNKKSGEIFISKYSESKRHTMVIIPIDIRFFHLKTTIINRFIHDFKLIEKEKIDNVLREYESSFIPIVELFDTEYKIAILASYAYLLSLDTETPEYVANLKKALDIMAKLRNSIELDPDEKEPFWGYVRNYQYGYITWQYSQKCDKNYKVETIKKAKKLFESSRLELPLLAENLRDMIKYRISLCDEQLNALGENDV